MNTLKLFLFLTCVFLTTDSYVWAQRSERYKSLSERSSSSGYSTHDRYQSKPSSERSRFDQNLNRYNSYSPAQKQKAQDKWNHFKQETTPEERKYIIEKMRRERRRR